CHDRPDGGVRVLAAVLTYARDVPLDVTWILVRFVERRVEQLNQAQVPFYQAGVERVERLLRAGGVARAGQDRPTLRQRVDLALRAGGGAHDLATVEVGPAVPLAVPGV